MSHAKTIQNFAPQLIYFNQQVASNIISTPGNFISTPGNFISKAWK